MSSLWFTHYCDPRASDGISRLRTQLFFCMACVGPSKGVSLSTLDLNHLIGPSYCYISKTPLSYGWALGGIRVLRDDSGFRVEAKAVLVTPTHGTQTECVKACSYGLGRLQSLVRSDWGGGSDVCLALGLMVGPALSRYVSFVHYLFRMVSEPALR